MWTVQVVVDSPVLDQHLGFKQGIEAMAVEELVAQAAVERLDPGVLPRLTGQSRPREVRWTTAGRDSYFCFDI
jgi:hypothetical protein